MNTSRKNRILEKLAAKPHGEGAIRYKKPRSSKLDKKINREGFRRAAENPGGVSWQGKKPAWAE